MVPHVMVGFTDHRKEKQLEVVVVLPMGIAHYNTTNTYIEVGHMLDKLQIEIILPNNMTDVMKLLRQFPCTWDADNISENAVKAHSRLFVRLL